MIPDAGATKKAYTWLKPDDRYIQGFKKRDRATGKLSGFGFMKDDDTPENLSEYNLVIVDDICDGGGTFIGLKEAMRKQTPPVWQPKSIELWVTHGMFQPERWLDLSGHFDRILSFKNDGNKVLVTTPPFQLFDFKDLL